MSDHEAPRRSEWFQPGTHSLWLHDREGRGVPALVAVFEWEIEGLRGVSIQGAWGDLVELKAAGEDWDVDYTMLHDECMDQEQLDVLTFAELVRGGHLKRIGVMPPINGFDAPPSRFVAAAVDVDDGGGVQPAIE